MPGAGAGGVRAGDPAAGQMGRKGRSEKIVENVELVFWVILAAMITALAVSAWLVISEEWRFRKWLREEQDRMIKRLEGFDDDKR